METLDIRTSDSWSLRADVHEPAGTAVGVAVLAHAAMARRSSFYRPAGAGLCALLVERGWRVVVFDFRGHGDSEPLAAKGARFGYDDLVRHDVPAVFSYAKSHAAPGLPVVGIGHSLGGHVMLAAQGTERVAFDAVVAVAANVWTRDLEPSIRRWLAKRASLTTAVAISRRVGRFPARALRMGSDDESLLFFEDWERFARSRWGSRDGREDYAASLGRVRCRVLQLVSDGDRLLCVPECGERFLARCGGYRRLERIVEDDDGGKPPTHMGILTSGRVASVWRRVEEWMRSSETRSPDQLSRL
jgi:predicted alpha/beta hydrolase